MAKRPKKPDPAIRLTPWTLCIWRGEVERCYYALVRFEQADQDIAGVQVMFVDNDGTVAYRRHARHWKKANGVEGDMLEMALPTGVTTSVADAVRYFTRRLLLIGGDNEAYLSLGVTRPQVVQGPEKEATPGKVKELDELYTRAAKLLVVPAAELRDKYSHLNRGLQAMNLRNRLRAKGHNV